MATFLNKLDRILKENFAGASTELESFEPRSKVGGFLVWKGFTDVDMRHRVRSVWEVLEQDLTSRELARATLILTFTPVEMAIRQEELALTENYIQRAARVRAS